MSDDNQPPPKTGYKSPPVEHRFKKGQSGNPAGRPPKPVRALLPRQVRRDILHVGEMETRVRTPDGEKVVSAFEAVLYRLLHRALGGHAPSMRTFLALYSAAVKEHAEEFKKYFDFVDMVEHEQVTKPVRKENVRQYLKFVNDLRNSTRRT